MTNEPLIVLEPLQAFLDTAGIGSGPLTAEPIGNGHSNVTYALHRGAETFVLRRPPRGPLPPSTHDVLREAQLVSALPRSRLPVPEILATCDDTAVIGAPFYVMPYIEGAVLTTELPTAFTRSGDPEAIAAQLVDALAELHAVDTTDLPGAARNDGYLERQLRRFRSLLERNATRRLRELEEVADWLDANRPPQSETTIVHGDYRLGNTIFAAGPRLVAVLDWEMATLGDPLADLGYMTAMWAQPDDPDDPMLELSRVTRRSGFPRRDTLAARYQARTGRHTAALGWYQALAVWKSAIFLENSYNRYLSGTTDDPYFGRLEHGVPLLARRARRLVGEL